MERRDETYDYVSQDWVTEHAMLLYIKYQQPNVGAISFPVHLMHLCAEADICVNVIGHSFVIEVSLCKNKGYKIKFLSYLATKTEDN